MPKANPFAQIDKRFASLQVKSSKMNEEILALVQLVEAEMKKQEAVAIPAKIASIKPAHKAVSAKVDPKAVPAKMAPAKVEKAMETPKKKSRPAKK